MNLLEIHDLEKSFSKKQIIKKISFNIAEGEIVGFVGPNGAGKTTTLKLITNLIFPDKGEIKINGFDLFRDREKALGSLSAIVETPGLYSYLSGYDNIEFIRKIRGISKEKMNSIISFVGLEDRIKDKVKKYSLGMKQRLALGMSLLSSPKLLILDEPTNGLDPSGTMELRSLITSLAKEQNVSILFSSHLLGEVEKISDKIIFIKDGEIVSIKDNIKNTIGQLYKISVEDTKKASELLSINECVSKIRLLEEGKILIDIKQNTLGEILKILTMNNISFSDVDKNVSGLEDDYNKIFKENI